MFRPRLLLADDHNLMVEGLRKLLEPEFEVVGTVDNGHDLLTAAESLQPDIILIDISMPLCNGLDAARRLRQAGIGARLVFVTMHTDPEYVREAFRAGASGYLIKRAAGSELLVALREVFRGRPYLTPLINNGISTSFVSESSPVLETPELTERHRQVLQLLAEGHTAKSIAELLEISPKTVEYHKACIMKRLGLRTTAELTRYAIKHGLVS